MSWFQRGLVQLPKFSALTFATWHARADMSKSRKYFHQTVKMLEFGGYSFEVLMCNGLTTYRCAALLLLNEESSYCDFVINYNYNI